MTIDTSLVDMWSLFYKNWYYYPDFVVSASLEKDLHFTMVDGPNVYKSGNMSRSTIFPRQAHNYSPPDVVIERQYTTRVSGCQALGVGGDRGM